jgi:hypothetical protein
MIEITSATTKEKVLDRPLAQLMIHSSEIFNDKIN